ncbi:MAG: hypothetical protein HY080_03340 [Gammaproteobacteria bacterium]|nr:hypothetical protein [Gammaproteobacteria bacterium]
MRKHLRGYGVVSLLLLLVMVAQAEPLRVDSKRVMIKNTFAQNLLKLNAELLAQHKIRKQTRVGGYANYPEFYLEDSNYDANTGKLISVVQWEKQQPTNLHSLEVYLYDAQGRVIRDYLTSYLPNARHAPVQNLISLHVYNGDYHAFRTFDAFGVRTYERCEKGSEIVLQLDEDEIHDAIKNHSQQLDSEPYLTCFKHLEVAADKYLIPN